MKRSRRIASHYTLAFGELIRSAIVSVAGDGTVEGVDTASRPDGMAGVEFYDGILIPGMVNAHCHLELSHMAGRMGPGLGYAGFARSMSELRGATEQERRTAAEFRDAAMWQQGVQAVGDVANGGSTFGIKKRSRIHYHTFIEMFGFDDGRIGAVEELAQEARAEGLSATVTPHSAYSLSLAGFEAAAGGHGEGPLSVHFMESGLEQELFDRKGEMWEWYAERGWEPDFTDYGSPAARIAGQVDGGSEILLVHNTVLTPEAAGMMSGHFGDKLTWVVCPRSNLFITGRRPPLELLRRSGRNIAVGTDSMASNWELSMAAEMRALQEQGAGLVEVLRWATEGGAKALGLHGRMGSIEPGRQPGIAVMTGIDWQTMTLSEGAATRRIL